MAETGKELIEQYLQEAIATEKVFHAKLREFATDGDDEEVQDAFSAHADETARQLELLAARLNELGSPERDTRSGLGSVLDIAPRLATEGAIVEERTLQHLLVACSIEAAECALYEVLATVAHAAGDTLTESLAREIEAEKQRAIEKISHFLPSRSKIAFNMLTVSEVDPAVETKAAGDRLLPS